MLQPATCNRPHLTTKTGQAFEASAAWLVRQLKAVFCKSHSVNGFAYEELLSFSGLAGPGRSVSAL